MKKNHAAIAELRRELFTAQPFKYSPLEIAETVARRHGMKFAVSNHAAHAWHWWQTAYGYDAEGPRAGLRYDAARLTAADGTS